MKRLTRSQKEMLATAFGTYPTHWYGHQLNKAAFSWVKKNVKGAVIDQGDASMPTTVSFRKRPYFTYSQLKELASLAN